MKEWSTVTELQDVSLDSIRAAADRIGAVIARTQLQYCERLSALTGASIYLKREDLQGVRSYKIRGAFNLMSQLTAQQRASGVVAASAGNHAQGVAWASRRLGVRGKIFVPVNTPKQKRDRILAHGNGQVELVVTGEHFDAAAKAAAAEAAESGATLIPPFDHPEVIAGQATVGLEIIEQLDGVASDTVIVPVGGGGLLGGIAAAVTGMSPATRFVAVEPKGAQSLAAARDAGRPVTLDQVDPFVDGAAVKTIGALPFELFRRFEDRITVTAADEGAVCTTMLDLYQNEGIIAEPAGALAASALTPEFVQPGQTVVVVVSGGNNDVSRYSEVLERSLVHRGLKHYYLVSFAQEPGQLRRFLDEVLGPEDDITLFEYVKRNNRETGAALVGIELGQAGDFAALQERMAGSRVEAEYLEPGTRAYEYLT